MDVQHMPVAPLILNFRIGTVHGQIRCESSATLVRQCVRVAYVSPASSYTIRGSWKGYIRIAWHLGTVTCLKTEEDCAVFVLTVVWSWRKRAPTTAAFSPDAKVEFSVAITTSYRYFVRKQEKKGWGQEDTNGLVGGGGGTVDDWCWCKTNKVAIRIIRRHLQNTRTLRERRRERGRGWSWQWRNLSLLHVIGHPATESWDTGLTCCGRLKIGWYESPLAMLVPKSHDLCKWQRLRVQVIRATSKICTDS